MKAKLLRALLRMTGGGERARMDFDSVHVICRGGYCELHFSDAVVGACVRWPHVGEACGMVKAAALKKLVPGSGNVDVQLRGTTLVIGGAEIQLTPAAKQPDLLRVPLDEAATPICFNPKRLRAFCDVAECLDNKVTLHVRDGQACNAFAKRGDLEVGMLIMPLKE